MKSSRRNSKRRKSKRSQRFSELARRRWSKVDGSDRAEHSTSDVDDSHVHVVTGGDNCETASDHVVTGGDNCETANDRVATGGDNCESLIDLCLFGDQSSLIEPVVEPCAEMNVGEDTDSNSGDSNKVNTVISASSTSSDSNTVISGSTSNDSEGESSEYLPTPVKKVCLSKNVSPIELGNSVFLCQTTQLQAFIDQVNETTLCYSPQCTGKLVPVNIKHVGLGGSVMVKFSCTGCAERMLNLASSNDIAFSRRMVCSLALQVAFIAGGCMHSQYNKILKQHLGMSAVNATTFYETVKLLHPIVNGMLNEMCNDAKSEIKMLDPSTVGSWQRAVTSSDGAWLTRGKFSQNCTFTIRNYVNNSLLYFVHLCMRGKRVDEDDLYRGTAKGAEGYAANMAFGQAKQEGLHIEIQWQDGDSSSAKSFRQHYPDKTKSQVMLCGGHVARAHTKHLGEISKQKSFSATMQDMYKAKFPDVLTVKCHCPKRHSKKCGCISKSFIRGARTNFFYCLLQAEKDPNAFASRLNVLGKYHARDIHTWGTGQCDFHDLIECSCGNCDDEVICCGKEYHAKNPLTCPFHALAYEIECHNRASQASHIIHTELGRGHSNYPEASHNVLVRYRSKDKYLQSTHYIVSTNMGLLQANMTWLGKKYGLSYHWLLDLFARLKLPLFDGMAEALRKGNEVRARNLEKKKTEEAKEKRIAWKKARVQEQEERKLWIRRQNIHHTYGSGDDNDEEDEEDDPVDNVHEKASSQCATSSKKCKCGSTDHKYTSHHKCPLNKKNKQPCVGDDDDATDTCNSDTTDTAEEVVENFCTCGTEKVTHSRTCPLNPRNYSV